MSATTSLKEQLQKLRAPQTNLLQDVRKRPSFMFDADKAASITRATFYEIGKNGLNELIALDSEFQKFSNTLFNESTLYFQRTVETKEVNEDIDCQIKELFYHLSPYFSIRPAHCVLEWLIVRYNVHMFNTDDLLFFLLPYYHTKLFARALQVVDIKTHFNRWSWLYKVRKHCIPLASDTLYTRCATDGFLLKLICQKTEEAVQLLASSPTKLSTVVNHSNLFLPTACFIPYQTIYCGQLLHNLPGGGHPVCLPSRRPSHFPHAPFSDSGIGFGSQILCLWSIRCVQFHHVESKT
uniref:HEAT repeat-containing protein 1 n=1 Tax=Cacopsylla melanoneura TaxID=428564 RepID=A0A8D9DY94_9HEMI